MSEMIGITTYASGEREIFTDPSAFIKTVKEELSYRNTTGFTFKVLTTNANVRKAVDDLVYGEFGEENPHDLSYYQSTKKELKNMTNSELNTALCQKIFAEQDAYRNWLLTLPHEKIIEYAYEYAVREDIFTSLINNRLNNAQAFALLQSPNPMEDVFRAFKKRETDYMDILLDCITGGKQ